MSRGGRGGEVLALEKGMDISWMRYRLFPYERRLGARELESLGAYPVDSRDGWLTVAGDVARIVERATYFESIAAPGQTARLTAQAAVERLHLDRRAGSNGRQATRFGLHGIHEYKGKFNPQVVRALCNVVDPDAELLVDPFCGSGTALIEGLRLGMDVIGLDRSPIACFLATAKVAATAAESKGELARELRSLVDRAAEALDEGQQTLEPSALDGVLASGSVAYLRKWFTAPAFAALSRALAVLGPERNSPAGQLALVALSSVLREVSLQLPEDLRIRRRPEPYTPPRIAPLFGQAAEAILDGLSEMEDWRPIRGDWSVRRASADDLEAYAGVSRRRRLILTSPPYATALPYIDTDRLSVVALGLADAKELLALERGLIGSREWTRSEEVLWDERRSANIDKLPHAVTNLLREIHDRNADGGAGFRRRAVPSLLYRYFARMGESFGAWSRTLRLGESAVVIVGHNRTTAGGERVDIATPELLGHVAEARGLCVSELIKLETWPRYGLHSANGVAGEDALVITRARQP